MLKRVGHGGLAGGGALILVLALSGVVAAASILTAIVAPLADPAPAVVDTTATFEDLDGNGIDDDCQETVLADPEAVTATEATIDADGDGSVSVTEAAHSDRIGDPNCNHGGYVSTVAQASAEPTDEETDELDAPEVEVEDPAETTECAPTEPVVELEAPAIPADLSANAHGKAVSEIARSDEVGGKNCNHGGAVSEVAKDTAAHEAAKAARTEAKAAAKAARDAARTERKANQAKGHSG